MVSTHLWAFQEVLLADVFLHDVQLKKRVLQIKIYQQIALCESFMLGWINFEILATYLADRVKYRVVVSDGLTAWELFHELSVYLPLKPFYRFVYIEDRISAGRATMRIAQTELMASPLAWFIQDALFGAFHTFKLLLLGMSCSQQGFSILFPEKIWQVVNKVKLFRLLQECRVSQSRALASIWM